MPLLFKENVPVIDKLLPVNDSFHKISYQGNVLKIKMTNEIGVKDGKTGYI